MNDTRPYNYVDAGPVAPPRADIIRRQDIVDQLGRMVDVYQEQQQAMLGTVTHGAHHGVFSTADQVRERRWTSAMYLFFYGFVAGVVMFGLTTIAYRFDVVDSYSAFAIWMVGTGSFALWLAWIRHGQELEQTPEAVARHIVDWHGSVAQYDAETRRISLELEYAAEQSRQQQSAQAAADARAQAADRMREIELRRDWQQAQLSRQYAVETPAITNQLSQPVAVDEPTVDQAATWQRDLLQWVGDIFSQGRINDAGTILAMVPWSQRSAWTEPDKAHARRILCEIRPALVVHDGNRWRWRVDLVGTAEQAIDIVSHRF